MTPELLSMRMLALREQRLSKPGGGATAARHRAIYAAGREDLSLAKLIEAHWDAVAILEEAGKTPAANATYAVWASEIPGKPLVFADGALHGVKEFCSGAPLVDRALVTAGKTLLEIDLHAATERLILDESGWQTESFRLTRTAAITFDRYPVAAILGEDDWYTQRIGFWQGACGPAAAWAGGAAGLLDYTLQARRDDPHTLAHLGAMHAEVWTMQTLLSAIGDEFDGNPQTSAMIRALEVRHMVEQMCTDILRRFTRALGPAPLVKHPEVARRYAELDLFLRQSHAERDLQSLGDAIRSSHADTPRP